MLRSILVGLDGSPFSQAAVELGLGWAKRFGCRVTAVGIIDEPTIRGPESIPIGGGAYKRELEEAQLEDARRQVKAFLQKFAEQCDDDKIACTLLEGVGWPHQQIVQEAQAYDLILMGQETYFHFETQQTSDETLQRVLHNTPRPVVAVPAVRRTGQATLVAFDGSLQAARALQVFLATGLDQLGEIHIVSIDKSAEVAAQLADRAARFLDAHDIKATLHPIESREGPNQLLLDRANQLGVELIVMGCYGESKLREFFLGSATSKMLKESNLPLFLYH